MFVGRLMLKLPPLGRFVQLFWDTLLKPLLATLQPDIEDKV